MNNRNKIRLIVACLLCAGMAQAKVTLPSIWGDNMVLQQQSEVHFHGKANVGKAITLNASWTKSSIKTKSDAFGHWNATIRTPAAGGPFTISISDGETLELKNILIGEVWFC